MTFSRFILGTIVAASLACPSMVRAEDAAAPSIEPSQHDMDKAEQAYLAGAKKFKAGNFELAEKDFLQATRLYPGKQDYILALTLAHQHRVSSLVQKASVERRLNHNEAADSLLAQAKNLDPDNQIVLQHLIAKPQSQHVHERFSSAIVLKPSDGRHSFHLREPTNILVEQIARTYGIRATFDPDVTSTVIRLDLDDVDYETVMHIVGQMADIMTAPLDDHSVLVAKNTQSNHDRLDHLEEEVVQLPGLNTEQLNSIANLTKQVFNVTTSFAQSGSGTLVLRALPGTLEAINETLDDLMDGGSEVLMRLQIYTISSTHTRDLGLTLPQGFSMINAGSMAQQIVSSNQDLVNQLIAAGTIPSDASNVQIALLLIASGALSNSYLTNLIGLVGSGTTTASNGLPDLPNNGYTTELLTANNGVVFNALLQNSDSQAVDDIQMRINDRQTGTFRIGTRYPITTSTYSSSSISAATSNSSSLASLVSQLTSTSTTVIPQIQYEDLGLTLKATPQVQHSGDISMDLDMKILALTGQSINNIPVLANRALLSHVTTHVGETILLTSVVSDSESMSLDGTPGLNELPGFQYLGSRNGVRSSTNLLMLLTPTLVRRGHLKLAGPYIPVDITTASN